MQEHQDLEWLLWLKVHLRVKLPTPLFQIAIPHPIPCRAIYQCPACGHVGLCTFCSLKEGVQNHLF